MGLFKRRNYKRLAGLYKNLYELEREREAQILDLMDLKKEYPEVYEADKKEYQRQRRWYREQIAKEEGL